MMRVSGNKIKEIFIFSCLWALLLSSQGSYTSTFTKVSQNDSAKPQNTGSISAPSTHCTSASLKNK